MKTAAFFVKEFGIYERGYKAGNKAFWTNCRDFERGAALSG